MKSLAELSTERCRSLVGVFCDIDDTLTHNGRLVPEVLTALRDLQLAGLRTVPVTGRPAGWVDHIARTWPVDGVVGENGGLWFWMQDGRLRRAYAQPPDVRRDNRAKLDALATRILEQVPGTALASDQRYRDLDLAIDVREDVPDLGDDGTRAVCAAFADAGATCKVSSIHVNGWFGVFDKGDGCRSFCRDRWNENLDDQAERWLYIGDSPNDEPLFHMFSLSVGVANVRPYLAQMTSHPQFVTERQGGHGFVELAQAVLRRRSSGA